MRIVHEEPGRRLELAETESRVQALAIGLALTALVATPWRALWAMLVHGAGRGAVDIVPVVLWGATGLFITLSAFGGHRLEGLSVDRAAGRLEWRRSHVLGLLRWSGGFPLESLDGFDLALVSRPGASSSRLRLTLRRRPGPGERRFDLTVSGLGGAERIADFALRVGAAAGLPFYRVTLNEGGRFAIELRADARPGFEPVPAVEGRGGAGSGALSSAVAAAVATERLPPFDPSAFRGNARVTVWEPGREVRFDKGWGAQVLLCPLLLAAALGPLSFVRMSSVQAMPLLPRTVTLVMLTLIGFGLAAVGWAGLYTGLPRHVRLDWSAGMLHVETLRRKRATPLTDIAGVELRHKSYSTGRARGGMVRTSCWSQVRLRRHGPADPPDELLAETRTFRNDASPPREMALPLARELAAALRVAVVETGRSRESS